MLWVFCVSHQAQCKASDWGTSNHSWTQSCLSFWHWPCSPLRLWPSPTTQWSKTVWDSHGSKLPWTWPQNGHNSDFFFKFRSRAPSTLSPWPLSYSPLRRCQDHLWLFLRHSSIPAPSSNVFNAQMSFLASNPPFCPAGSRVDFRISFPDSVPFAQPFSSKNAPCLQEGNELFPLCSPGG